LGHKPLFTSYIIHIYRLKKGDSRSLVGLVEEVGLKGKKGFANYDELWDILSSPLRMKRREKRDQQR